jgi:hypothetical protein
MVCFAPEYAGKYAVKSADIKVAGFGTAKQVGNPFLHFGGSLVGKSKREYVKRINLIMPHQVGNAGGEYFGFAAAGPGHNHQRAIFVYHGFALMFIQSC